MLNRIRCTSFIVAISIIGFSSCANHNSENRPQEPNQVSATVDSIKDSIAESTQPQIQEAEAVLDDSYEFYMSKLKSACPQSHLKFIDKWIIFYDDYDSNGSKEMIAFSIEEFNEDEFSSIDYCLHLINSLGYKKIHEDSGGWFYLNPTITKEGKYSTLSYEYGYGGPVGERNTWTYSQGELTEQNMPGNMVQTSGKNYSCEHSDIGTSIDEYGECGRFWTEYDFFFDGKEFVEYGGILISPSDLSKLQNGASLISELKMNGLEVSEIIYRSNNTIDINCRLNNKSENRIDLYYLSGLVKDNTLQPFSEQFQLAEGFKRVSISNGKIKTPKNFPY